MGSCADDNAVRGVVEALVELSITDEEPTPKAGETDLPLLPATMKAADRASHALTMRVLQVEVLLNHMKSFLDDYRAKLPRHSIGFVCSSCNKRGDVEELDYLAIEMFFCDTHARLECRDCLMKIEGNEQTLCLHCDNHFCSECERTEFLCRKEHFVCDDCKVDLCECASCEVKECQHSNCDDESMMECINCGDMICGGCSDDAGFDCEDCGEWFCEACDEDVGNFCEDCGDHFCDDCIVGCESCDGTFCGSCMSGCERSEECENCHDSLNCEFCNSDGADFEDEDEDEDDT